MNGSLMNLGSIADIRRTYQEHYLTVDGISEGFAESLKTTIHKIIPEAIEDPTSSDEKRMIFRVKSKEKRIVSKNIIGAFNGNEVFNCLFGIGEFEYRQEDCRFFD